MSQVRTAVRGQVRSAIRGNVGNPVGFSAPFYGGIHLDFRTGRHYVKAPGASPTVAPFTTLFTFTGDNQSKYRGTSSGLLIPSVTNTPRIEYDANGNVLGLLMEGSRQNLCLQSETMQAAPWAIGASSISINAGTSPDGGTTAEKIVEDSASARHLVTQSIVVTPATTYTWSVWAKASGRTWLAFNAFLTAVSDNITWFNLSGDGSVGTNAAGNTATITAYANGWYRCTITRATGVAIAAEVSLNAATGDNVVSYLGDGASGILVWGAQLEQAAFPSSYIPTTTVAVTRAAETCARTLAAEYVGASGTIFAEARTSGSVTANATVAQFDDGTTNESHRLWQDSGGVARGLTIDGGATQANLTDTTVAALTFYKSTYAWQLNDFAFVMNGRAPVTLGTGTMPSPTTLNVGVRNAAADPWNGHIRRLDYYPTRLANNVLQQMTA